MGTAQPRRPLSPPTEPVGKHARGLGWRGMGPWALDIGYLRAGATPGQAGGEERFWLQNQSILSQHLLLSQFGKVSFLRQVTLGLSEKVPLPNSPPDANLGEGHAGQRDSEGMVVKAWCSWDPLMWDMGYGTWDPTLAQKKGLS